MDHITLYFSRNKRDTAVSNYVHRNLTSIKNQFLKQNSVFFIYPEGNDIKTLTDLYLYCFPFLEKSIKELKEEIVSINCLYNQCIEEGFLVIHKGGIDVVEYDDRVFFEIQKLYKNLQPTFWEILFNKKKTTYSVFASKNYYIKYLYKKQINQPELVEQVKFFLEEIRISEGKKLNEAHSNIFYSIKEATEEEKLAKWLIEIENKLNRINSTELLFNTVSKLNSLITKQYNNLIIEANFLKITKDYRVLVNNHIEGEVEIPMSDLTKVVYLLFCNHPKGINIKELCNYKDELLSIYSNISSLSNYDKMVQNINKLCDRTSKEIYVHISRVKKEFEAKVPYFSEQYIITSDKHGSPVKYIKAL